jgi:hypothetical protein
MKSPSPAQILSAWNTLGIINLALALLMLVYGFLSQNELDAFRQHGIYARASVIDKVQKGKNQASVSYLDRTSSEGEVTRLATINQFISTKTFLPLQVGGEVAIVYLAEDPINKVILEAALDPANLAPYNRYDLGLILLASGGFAFLIRWGLKKMFTLF